MDSDYVNKILMAVLSTCLALVALNIAAGAVFSPQDHQVDNRRLGRALAEAARKAGAVLYEHDPVREVWTATRNGGPRNR